MRQTLLLNDDWKFYLGDLPTKEIMGHHATYMHSKAKNGMGAAAPNFYDGDFRTVHLPHDYVLEGELSNQYNESQGSYKRENAWYRKHFNLPCKVDESRVVLLFDGAGKKTSVWCNGHYAGDNNSMYNSFYVDITPYLVDDEVNTLSVKIENDDIEGWWYEGAGLYRNVWMIVTDKLAVDVWGTYVNPTLTHDNIWMVPVETTLFSNHMQEKHAIVTQFIYDKDGKELSSVELEVTVPYGETKVEQELVAIAPTLWDLESCYLHTLKTQVVVDDVLVDEYETPFGFRTIAFNGESGFYLNGKHVKMHGVCMHQDHANLGTAMPAAIEQYRIDKMKAVGINTYRSAHNNPSPSLLNICDNSGILVIDENRWFNYSQRSQKELISMVKRDRNHPSVVVWAVGNEEPLQSTITGKRLIENLKSIVKQYDTTRPVTIALNGGFYDSYAAAASDVVAVNYNIHNYDKFPEAHPNKCIVATESGASNNTRGIYFRENDKDTNSTHATAYDEKHAAFGSAYIDAIRASETHDFVAGTCAWAGMSYRGEASWPKLFADCGFFDACGLEKDNAYMAKSCWMPEPMVHILPHWNLQGHEGETIRTVVYANVDEVELFVNGASQGRKPCQKYYAVEWDVTYQPGSIHAVGYQNGTVVAEATHETTGAPVAIQMNPHTSQVTNSGEDYAIFDVCLVDAKGHIVPDATNSLSFALTDETQGDMLCVSNGNPLDHSHAKDHTKQLFSGWAQVVIRAKEGAAVLNLQAECAELGLTASASLPLVEVAPLAKVEASARNMSVDSFRAWFGCEGFDAVHKEYKFDDMNTSEPISFATYQPEVTEEYVLLTAKAVMPECDKQMNLVFDGMQGAYAVRIFHDDNTWPHPTPEEFINLVTDGEMHGNTLLEIPLMKFAANEKIKIILVQKRQDYAMREVYFTVNE